MCQVHFSVLLVLALLPLGASSVPSPVNELSENHLKRVYGRIQFVDSCPDYKVEEVTSFPDLLVQRVSSFPDGPGRWEIVDSFPDFKIQLVDSFPDFTIEYVDSFPGIP
ncbi:MAG: hypothetical protein AAF357_01445 [Verrucomicrobiota bacterium]